ncbi:uncharacterized protein CEXT_778721 [Caerostris extrusa]|uniref:Uncharacterized protein n=1 Tax=Caerostris extrusa TaxID=172846 RepID=A0AAV4XKD3_CAEEX|nr:uncharacterized protein CEXT_778721 [Caerostris extrusa]
MKLDLNIVLKEIYSLKIVLCEKDEEIEKLHKQLANSCRQNKILKDTHASLLSEITQLNNALSDLHVSISEMKKNDVERKTWLLEKENLQNVFIEKKSRNYVGTTKRNGRVKKRIKKIQLECKENMKKEQLQIESKALLTYESYINKVKEKENQILALQEEKEILQNEKNQELVKISIEFEEKLNKLKSQLSKTKGTHPLQDHLRKDDIFRQKYIQIEKESKEETSKLKKQIQELQSQVDNLKYSNRFLNLQQTTPQNITRQERDKLTGTAEESFKHATKRLKTNENEFSTFNKNEIKSSLSEPAKSIKKKLFNIDQNYFGKSNI